MTIEVEAPDGSVVEFPQGTPREVIASAMSRNYGKPAQPKGGDYARGFGVGARNILEGALALPGMAADAVMNTGAAMGINEPPKTPANRIIPDMLGLPEANTPAGRVVGRGVQEVAAALPTMGAGALLRGGGQVANLVGGALTSQIPAQIGGAAGSGLAAGAASEKGGGAVEQFLAGLAGGVTGAGAVQATTSLGRLAQAAFQPFTRRGRESMAADALVRASAAPDAQALQARIDAGVNDTSRRVPGSPATTAQAAMDPGIAVLEQGLRNDPTRLPGQGTPSGAVAIRDAEAGRNAARSQYLSQLQPLPNTDPAARGAFVRDAISQAEQASLPGGAANFARNFLRSEAGDDFYGNLDALSQQRSAAAKPLYDTAMSANAWSPRIAEFVDDPISKAGLARGLRIQRLEARARNEQFDPTQLGVTFNAAGDPVLTKQPNMRVLDMVKAGLDDILEGYRDKTTGRLVLDREGRAIDEFRRAYVGELKSVNPAYADALGSWAGPSQSMDALAAGRDALRGDPEQVAKRLQGMADGDKDFFRAGILRDLQDRFAKGDEQAFELFRNPNTRRSMEAAFGKENIDALSQRLTEHAARFGRDASGSSAVGQILKRDSFGRPIMADDGVAARALSSPDNLKQVLRAAGPKRNDAIIALQSEFIARLTDRATLTTSISDANGQAQRALSASGFQSFLDDNSRVASRLFTPRQMEVIQRLSRDFEETGAMANSARARGSDTAQNLTVANLIARVTNGLIDPANPTAQTVAGLGPVMRLIYQAPEAAVRELISEAVVNPRAASALLAKATPQNVQRAADFLNKTMPERLALAARQAGTRATARTANEIAVQQQSDQ